MMIIMTQPHLAPEGHVAFGHFLQCSHQKIGVPTGGTTHSLEVALHKSVSKINAMSYKICKRCHLYFFFF